MQYCTYKLSIYVYRSGSVIFEIFGTSISKFEKDVIGLFALLYLRFALWWLDLNLLSGPDALQKGRS